VYWGYWVPRHDRWTRGIDRFLLAIAFQQTTLLLIFLILEGYGAEIPKSGASIAPPSIGGWCIVSYFVVLILSWYLWAEFHRIPYLKRGLLGCALGYYASALWTVMNVVLWLILPFMVIPVAMTLYLFYYMFKAERVVPTGL
jgi:hypothetical protein